VKVRLLQTEGCSNAREAEPLVREVLAALAPATTLEVVTVTSEAQLAALRFAGSPTILVDGVDLEPGAPVCSGFG
jgi:hypothetical protein